MIYPRKIYLVLSVLYVSSLSACIHTSVTTRHYKGKTANATVSTWSRQNLFVREGINIAERESWKFKKDNKSGKTYIILTYQTMGHSQKMIPCSGLTSFKAKAQYIFLVNEKATDGKYLFKLVHSEVSDSPCKSVVPNYVKGSFRKTLDNRIIAEISKSQKVFYPQTATGVWKWVKATNLPQNNEKKLETEEWILNQNTSGKITGYYNRYILRLSTNNEKYTCNGKTMVALFSRYKIEGVITRNGEILLKEVKYVAAKNDPCEPSGERYLDRFKGILIGNTIQIKSSSEGIYQTLQKEDGEISVYPFFDKN